MNVELMNNNHSVFPIRFHLILVVKYRKKAIDDEISERLKGIFRSIEGNYNIALEEWNHDMDHVRILFRSKPDPNVPKSASAYKSASSRSIKREYPSIRPGSYREAFRSRSFRPIPTGGTSMEASKEYIESQGERSPIRPLGMGGL